MQSAQPAQAGLGGRPAAALVFGSSAAVLVVELAALRLLAPHFGLTLEMNTLVIGIVLTAIAVGSWVGGSVADRVDPRLTLAPLLACSGVVVAASPTFIRAIAPVGDGSVLLLGAALALFVPGALLSAVAPMVIKLRLRTLAETGTVVGRLSGVGTAGAIFGTVMTGFVLISAVRVSTILVSLGVALVVASVLVGLRARGLRAGAGPAALLVLIGLAALVVPSGCDVETRYHCASVEVDETRESGRVLLLDRQRHSYIDLDDPTHLEFTYVRAIASVVDTVFAPDESLSSYHLGGGLLTVPRYLSLIRPGSDALVSEIDPGVVQIGRERFGLTDLQGVDVRVEDGRLGLERLAGDSRDLVVGDAFGGVSVPWHLTTVEAMQDVRRALTDDGVYVANLIDHEPFGFARAEVATLEAVFDHVALAAEPQTFGTGGGGNLVVVASDEPIDLAAWRESLAQRAVSWEVVSGSALETWRGDAASLTDEYAPVDQLLTPYGPA